jgi:hypothetical protein
VFERDKTLSEQMFELSPAGQRTAADQVEQPGPSCRLRRDQGVEPHQPSRRAGRLRTTRQEPTSATAARATRSTLSSRPEECTIDVAARRRRATRRSNKCLNNAPPDD